MATNEIKSKYGVHYTDPNYQKMVQQRQLETHCNMRIRKDVRSKMDIIKGKMLMDNGIRLKYSDILEAALDLYMEKNNI